MSNSRENRAKGAADTAASTGSTYGTGASAISGQLVPQLQAQAAHPTGENPTDINAQLVAGEQGAGGANAGITGQANLQAARTRNSGALSGVLDQAARLKQQALSNNALGVQTQNAKVKLQQQQDAMKGLEGIYGTDVGAQLKAEQLVPEDINAATGASQTGAQQNAMKWAQIFGGK